MKKVYNPTYYFVIGWLNLIEGIIEIVTLGFIHPSLTYPYCMYISKKTAKKKMEQNNG
jgi:hypothetical protein